MKQRLKGLLALVLSLVMVLGMVTVGSASQSSGGGSAPTTYPVSIGGVEFASNNLVIDSDDITGVTGTATYVPADGANPATLTLDGFNGGAISASNDLTIVLEGENTITTTSDKGISVIGNLTIEGSNGKVTATGVKYGIYANSVTITGGTVTAGSATDDDSGDVIYNSSFGIKAESSISITGGTVTATGSDAIAINEHTTGTISISGATTKVIANGKNSGIYAKGSVSIAGGSVLANSTNDDGWGIYGGGDVTIKDGAKVEANASDISGIGIGTIYSTNSTSSANTIVISGEGTEVKAGCHTGLSAYEVTILENSKLTIDAATTSAIVCGELKFSDFTHTNNNWYQWKADSNPVEKSSDTNQLLKTGAKNAKFLTIEGITYTIAKAATSNGSFTVSAETAAEGTEITITPSANSGYIVDTITVTKDGSGTVAVNNNKFTMPATNVTVAVTFKTSVGQSPGTPQQPSYNYPIAPTTPEPEGDKVTAPKTFDGGIVSAVVVSILSATGGAWLAKKKD